MRLGTETASIDNWMMSGTKGQPTPQVGMGATILMWTDRKACTIAEIKTFKGGARQGQISVIGVRDTYHDYSF